MKAFFLILPGMTDFPLGDLNNKTPLEVAQIPNMDRLFSQSTLELLPQPSQTGLAPSFLALVGEGPHGIHAPTGPLLARCLSYTLTDSQVAYAVRLASSGDDTIVDVSDDLVSHSEGKAFFAFLNEHLSPLGLHFVSLKGPLGVLITDRDSLVKGVTGDEINAVDLIGKTRKEGWPSAVAGDQELLKSFEEASEKALQLEVNAMRHDLEEDPINTWILWGGGRCPATITGLQPQWTLWTSQPVLEGAARTLKGSVMRWKEEDERFDWVRECVDKAKNALEEDTIYCELPYLWDATYKGNLLEKIKTLEWLDGQLIAPLVELCERQGTPFHLTPLVHTDIRRGRIIPGETPILTYTGVAQSEPLPFAERSWREVHVTP